MVFMPSVPNQNPVENDHSNDSNVWMITCPNGGFFEIQGKDAPGFLHRQLSQEIRELQVGQGAPTCLLNKEGRVLLYFDLWKTESGYQAILFEKQKDQFFPLLDRVLFTEDVRITDQTANRTIRLIFGEGVPALIDSIVPTAAYRPYSSHTVQRNSIGMTLYLMDWLMVPSLLLVIDGSPTPEVENFLEELHTEPTDWFRFHALRIEKGTPWPEFEVDETFIPYECGLEMAFSVTKGCYVGQEIISRIHHLGKPPRILRGLRLEGTDIPSRLEPVLDSKGTEVGKVLSACWSQRLQAVIATSAIRTKASQPGNALSVSEKAACVAALPF